MQQGELIRLMREEWQAQGQQRPREHQPRGITYKDFEDLRPPVFTMCPEPLAANDWLRTIESKFTLLPGLTRVGESSVCRTATLGLSWSMSFIHLSQYSPGDVADDPSRAARLLSGFDPTLMMHLGREYQSFTQLVDIALDMENRLRVVSEDQKRKRQANNAPGSSQKQKANYLQPQQYHQQSRFCSLAQSIGLDSQGTPAAEVPHLPRTTTAGTASCTPRSFHTGSLGSLL
ncbi:hypothetical protein U9M48_024206 [Paspalum notatum var. saurae]|uniref:Uncharacterized protein n=1 Tax=Paspalum notatum var. saurae TaxID=547442 RepID=A0AAQ3TN47_PASNO